MPGRRSGATSASIPMTIAVRDISPLEQAATGERGRPFVLVVTVDLGTTPRPAVGAMRYGPWGDSGEGAGHNSRAIPADLSPAAVEALANFAVLRRPFWGLDGRTARPIERPEAVIILVALLEHDQDATGAARQLVRDAAKAALAETCGLARAALVRHLIAVLNRTLADLTAAPTPFDRDGGMLELALALADLHLPTLGPHTRSLIARGRSGPCRIDFEFLPAERCPDVRG